MNFSHTTLCLRPKDCRLKKGKVIDMEARVNKDMIIMDMLKLDPGIAAILMASGMHCIGCPSAQGESLEQAAMVHGLNADDLVNAVNDYLAKK